MTVKKSILTLLVCLSALLAGCEPEGVLTREEMTSLLADLYLADGCIEAAGSRQQAWDSLDMYGPVLEAHAVTPELFNASIEYYLAHPDDFIKIYKNAEKMLAEQGRQIEDKEMVEEFDEEPPLPEGAEPDIEKEDPAVQKDTKPDNSRKKGRKRLSKKEMKELEKQLGQ